MSSPVDRRTHACAIPAPRSTASARLGRGAGTLGSEGRPSGAIPQHQTEPGLTTLHVHPRPAPTAVAGGNPTTRTGVGRCSVVPSPSSPYSLFPQHHTSPRSRSAQVCSIPAANPLTRARFGTGRGRQRVVESPPPSWPSPSSPQHHTSAPTVEIPHVCCPPTTISEIGGTPSTRQGLPR